MSEQIIQIENVSPIDLYGPADKYLDQVKSYFPKLRIVARGDFMKVIGDPQEMAFFSSRFELLIVHLERFGKINNSIIEQIMQGESDKHTTSKATNGDVLVHGRAGMQVKAITANQKRMVSSSEANDLVFAIGPAGTGKTYTAIALAVRALKNKQVKRIILTRPAVEAGENLGFLPGDMKDKLDPYMQPLYDALRDMLPTQKLLTYLEDGTIEVAPLAFMRGRTLDHAFVILDEAQNASRSQLKMFLTRMGKSSHFIVTGDVTQIDLPARQPSGLLQATKILKDVAGIDFIMLDDKDVVRHKLVTKIILAYQETEPKAPEINAQNNTTT
ncbi:MAG: PhoH family protein [Bacteroidetes bacterium]|jgi:phosphate starvation-inducible PhoH-like protein|nr:PhoH family protein [Bacteroidota bacterium]MBU1578880.1 PhoH family protein [Bacteroidota bacterium]MBU2465043.1 PhoH family protein [Bacteroidota bacterium]MBU2558342.1 PhoH family protein [Bacteroidota bacterium]MDA3942146.1 PhoH family protein [Bacteroidota bacterium]